MKARNTVISSALMFAVTLFPIIPGVKTVESAHAQWVVFDPTNFGQNILTAARTLQSNINEAAQIAELVNQYNQMLTEYATMLTNLTSLPSSLKGQVEASLGSMLADINTQFGQSSMSAIAGIDPALAGWKSAAESLLKPVFGQPIDATALSALLTGASAADAAKISATNAAEGAQYDRYLDSYKMQGQALKNAVKRTKDAKDIATDLTSQGDQSELQTLQAMAQQNNILIQQLEEVIKATNQTMVNATDQNIVQATSGSIYRAAKLQKAQDAQVKSIPAVGYAKWPTF